LSVLASQSDHLFPRKDWITELETLIAGDFAFRHRLSVAYRFHERLNSHKKDGIVREKSPLAQILLQTRVIPCHT
jgi:hypothetical protein